ncbi:hypothetical protein AJ79_08765 [Helicocarpus griseus UAMH5409]|uniref:tRNA-splicing endonuclease subunit Sen54 N-terminal domain-containing protein n=1 Tax=Helicocarpus griseus UAMH5409 TaxID=1447875 RepID=A0A2B7WPP1_9EURO|nr:hypothetical protein AJ79_08765 [Helicocarpus griseus UAMH5409]
MADTDEDALYQPPSTSQDQSAHIDHDLSDETQDFRILNSLSFLSDPSQSASLPRRGEKDFEPNPTLRQADVLAASRDAMHNALAYPRLHNPKTRVVGIYCPTGLLRPARAGAGAGGLSVVEESSAEVLVEEERQEEQGGKAAGKKTEHTTSPKRKPTPPHGVGKGTCVCVTNPRGQHFKAVGRSDYWNRVWLLPEEALYLLERGSLDIRWPAPVAEGGQQEENVEDMEGGVPMSLQAAYACFIGRGALSLDRYIVYAGLRRGGYTVIRAPTWDEGKGEAGVVEKPATVPTTNRAVELYAPAEARSEGGLISLLTRFFNSIYKPRPTGCIAHGPVIGLGIHRSYHDIYRALSIIPTHNPTLSDPSLNAPSPTPSPPYHLAYYVYKPNTPFRKSTPGSPDFRLAVIDSRTHPTLPTLNQLSALLASTPLDPPVGEKMERLMYMRLRHGWRNVILAVVDQGVVSFLRVGDAGFGGVRIFEGGGVAGNKGPRRSGGNGGNGGKKGRR